MGKTIGIDLGTTNCVVAICDGPKPRILDNREAHAQTRSVVSLRKRKRDGGTTEETLAGEAALDNWPLAPKDTILSVKRLMGRAVDDPEVQNVRSAVLYEIVEPSDGTKESVRVVMGGKQYSPPEISSIILKKLKADAEYRLGEEVTHAVITVPAYFTASQRKATFEAGNIAGLKVIKILAEPTAAAISFGIESGDGTPKTVLVYDLGGGTFDISILTFAGNAFAPLTLQGDMWLGGDDFDQVLVDRALEFIRKENGIDPSRNMRFMVELKKAAQKTKESLSANRSADLMVTGLLQDKDGNLIDLQMEITQEAYARMIQKLVNKTVTLTKKALAAQEFTPDDIDYVLMAGNSTGVPQVQQAMEDLFGANKVMRKIHPKHCVALGAAILAARLGIEFKFCPACDHGNKPSATVCENEKCHAALEVEKREPGDTVPGEIPNIEIPDGGVAPYNYGTQSAGDKFTLFVKKDESVPTENPQWQTFYTRTPNARMISIPVFGGENLEKASLNKREGEAFAILPPRLPKDTAVRVKVWLDSNGMFLVAAQLEDGADLHPWIVKGESDAKVIQAVENVDQMLAKKGAAVSPEEKEELDEAKNKLFDDMRKGNVAQAQKQAERLLQLAEHAGEGEGDLTLESMAENLIGFTEFVLHEYAWALEANAAYSLNSLLEEAKRAMEKKEKRTLEQKVQALKEAIDRTPETIRIFLNLRGAINLHIHPVDPVLAMSLMEDLDDVETGFKTRKAAAPSNLNALAAKVTKAIEEARKKQPMGFPCANGHIVPPNERRCPVCGDDMSQLNWKGSVSSSTGGLRR